MFVCLEREVKRKEKKETEVKMLESGGEVIKEIFYYF